MVNVFYRVARAREGEQAQGVWAGMSRYFSIPTTFECKKFKHI